MKKFARRRQKAIAIALLFLNLTGARAVAVTDPCAKTRSFFAPSRGFRCVTKKLLRRECKNHARHHRSLGERKALRSSQELETLRPNIRAVSFDDYIPTYARIEVSHRPRTLLRLYARKLATDISPVQPTHLHSKK